MKGRCIRHGREHGDTYSKRRCIEEGCEKVAQGGMKGRCVRHGREHGGSYNAPRCKEDGCEKYACVKGRCTRHDC